MRKITLLLAMIMGMVLVGCSTPTVPTEEELTLMGIPTIDNTTSTDDLDAEVKEDSIIHSNPY